MIKIGHRGASGHAPENTLESFRKALEMNVDAIELDVHLTSDDQIVVIHDETIDRTTIGSGAVKDLTLREIRSFSGNSVPTLPEVLTFIDKRCIVNIELKGEGTALPVVSLIDDFVQSKNWNYDHFLLSSFDWTALQMVREQNQQIPLGVLTATDLNLAIGFATFINAETIHPHFHLLDKQNTLRMQQHGFSVMTWTVNEPEDIDLVKSYNVNGIITDYPDRL